MVRRLAALGVDVVERAVPVGIGNGDVVLSGVFGEALDPAPADPLVAWCGGATDLSLPDALAAAGSPALVIDDALRPRRVIDAMREEARCEQMATDQGLLAIRRSTG
jgi:hypothetical protein